MHFNTSVSPRVFRAIQNVDIDDLARCSPTEIRPILPCLVRMSLISPLDNTRECAEGRKEILTLLSGIELVNSIVALLSIDFHQLETDVKKEQQLRQKLGSAHTDSILVQSLPNGLALEFERSDSTRRLHLVLSELLFISAQLHEQLQRGQQTPNALDVGNTLSGVIALRHSDLFDNAVYMEEICDVICIALAELPAVLNITEVVETLLHVKHGPYIICWVVANSPDCFREANIFQKELTSPAWYSFLSNVFCLAATFVMLRKLNSAETHRSSATPCKLGERRSFDANFKLCVMPSHMEIKPQEHNKEEQLKCTSAVIKAFKKSRISNAMTVTDDVLFVDSGEDESDWSENDEPLYSSDSETGN